MADATEHGEAVEPVAAPPSASPAVSTAVEGGAARVAALARSFGSSARSVPRTPVTPQQVLALQRTAGNAHVGRMLARKPGDKKDAPKPAATQAVADEPPLLLEPGYAKGEMRIMPPNYAEPEKVVGWLINHVHARRRDAAATIQDGRVWLYNANNDKPWAVFNSTKPVLLPDYGVWKFDPLPHGGPKPVLDTGQVGVIQLLSNEAADLVPESQKGQFMAHLPEAPNVLWVAYGNQNEVVVRAKRPEKRTEDPEWATKLVDVARALVKAPGPDDSAPAPSKLTAWHKDEVEWFVDVWLKGDVRTLKLKPEETANELAKRIKQATKEMRAEDDPSRSTRIKGTKPGDPYFKPHKQAAEWASRPGSGEKPISNRRPNAPPFPARIYSTGPEGQAGNQEYEHTVTGASVSFVMDLNYAAVTSGFWEEFGARFQFIDYQWELFDLTKIKLSAIKDQLGRPSTELFKQMLELQQSIDEAPEGDAKTKAQAELEALKQTLSKRGDETDSGAWRDIVRDWGNTVDDTEADLGSVAMWIPGVNVAFASLVAISDIVQFVGAPIKVGFSKLAAPTNQQEIAWPREGTFLLRCWAQPVITQEDVDKIHSKGLEAIIRPPSIAHFPVRVTAINTRSQEANDAELTRIQSLKDQLAQATELDAPEDIQDEIDWAMKSYNADNIGALDVADQRAQREIKRIDDWKAAQVADKPLSEMTTPEELALRRWKARLDIAGIRLDDYRTRLETERESLAKMRPRLSWSLGEFQGAIYRPRMTIVSELDGRVLPIVANLVHDKDSEPDSRIWRLIDVSSEETKRQYVGKGSTHNEAINAAFEDFKDRCGYGRGTISIRLPQNLRDAVDGETLTVPAQMRAKPGFGQRFEERLQNLATAAEVAGLFISGPVGVAIGIGGGILGAGLAIKNFAVRMSEGKPFLSYETGMDALAVVGALVAVAGGAAKSARLAALAKRARWVGNVLHIAGTGVMAGQVIAIPLGLYMELVHIDEEESKELAAAGGKPIDRGKYTARRMEAFARAVKAGIVTVRMVQMAENPELGWNPLEKKGPGGKRGGGYEQLPPANKELPPANKELPPAGKDPAGSTTTSGHPPPAEHTAAPVVERRSPLRAAEVAGEVTPGQGEPLIKAAGDWKNTLKKLISKFAPDQQAQAAKELNSKRAEALDQEYQKAEATHGCKPFDVGTVGFDSDIDATMMPKERLRGFSGKERSTGEQIQAAAEAAQQVTNGLRKRFGGDPDAVLDVAIHAYVGEDLAPQYASPAEAAAARAHDTAVSFAEARRGMTREQWKAFEKEFESRLGYEGASKLELGMLERIKSQMIEGFRFKGAMDELLGEYVGRVSKEAKAPLRADEAKALARDRILLDKRQELAKAFEQTPRDWVKIKRLQSEIRWFAPGAYATEAAFTHAVKYGQVRKEAGKTAAKSRGSTEPTAAEVAEELDPNLEEERWVSPQERSNRLANAATGNVGEFGRHPHGGEPKNRAKDAAKYAGRALEVAEAMGRPVRHGPMEDALRGFKQSKWGSGDAALRDEAVARWAKEAIDGKGVERDADGKLKISDETYNAFADAAEQWLMRSAVESRIHEGWLADQDQVPARPAPKPKPPEPGPAAAIGLSEGALTNVLAAMPPETALAVAGWLGKERLERISTKPERLKLLLEAHNRLAKALTDPQAVAGLRRLTETDPKLPGAQKGLGEQKVIDAILKSNADNLELALRVLGRPDMQTPGAHPQRSGAALPELSRDRTRLEVIDRHGVDAYAEIARNRDVRIAMEDRLAGLDEPTARAAEIDRLLGAETTRQRKEMLGIYKPRKQRIKQIEPDMSDPVEWQEYLDDAKAYLDDPEHAKALRPGSDDPYSTMTEPERQAFIKARATLLQVRDEIANPKNYEKYQKLPQAEKLRLLDQMDALGKKAGILQNWNPRAQVAEALFVPGGGFGQRRIPNPVFPAKRGGEGYTRLDGVYAPGHTDNPIPGTRTWVEFKSYLLENMTERTAADHASEGFQDWHALLHDRGMRDDAMAIQYARVPKQSVKDKMVAQLLGPKSPFKAVKFGDEPWIMRPESTPMPVPLALPIWWNNPK